MAHINLLPWRETLKRERQIRFGIAAGIVLAIALVIWGSVFLYMTSLREYHQSRNDYLGEQIKLVEKQIAEIKDLQKKRQRLIDRMTAIQKLEENRNQIVHLFDEIVLRRPDGVYFNSLSQKGDKITLVGVAQSDARVSNLMDNIDRSEWLKSPDIRVIRRAQQQAKNTGAGAVEAKEFTLVITQSSPKTDAEKEKEAAEKAKTGK